MMRKQRSIQKNTSLTKTIQNLIYKLALILSLVSIQVVKSDELLPTLYQRILTDPNVLILNNTNAFGGSQGLFGSTVGVLYHIDSTAALETFISSTSSTIKYALFMPYELVDKLPELQRTGKVAGVLLYKTNDPFNDPNDPNKRLSMDEPCHNCQYSLYSKDQQQPPQHTFNPDANSFTYSSFGFPIQGMWKISSSQNQSFDEIVEASQANFDRDYEKYPLYQVEFESFQNASQDSITCLRRGRCVPLGGNSVWSTFSSNIEKTDGKPIIVISSKLDSTSLVNEFSVGSSWFSAVVTQLAVADALKKSPVHPSQFPKHLLFTFFNGEEWGYSGSKRFIKDLTNFECTSQEALEFYIGQCSKPFRFNTNFTRINFESIETIIEFSHVGGFGLDLSTSGNGDNSTVPVYMHSDNVDVTNSLSEIIGGDFSGTFGDFSINGNIQNVATSQGENVLKLPPSSSESFLEVKRSIGAIVIGDYKEQYTSRYVNSDVDDGFVWNDSNIALMCGIATKTAKALWTLVQENSTATAPEEVSADCNLIKEFMTCFTRNASCTLGDSFFPENFQRGIFPDVGFTRTKNFLSTYSYKTFFIREFMQNTTSSDITSTPCNEDKDCKDVQGGDDNSFGYTCAAKLCSKAVVYYHDAYSTGLEFDPTVSKYDVVDQGEAIWTESFAIARSRVFLSVSGVYEGLSLGFALLVSVLTGCCTFYIRKWLLTKFKND